jgi:predicted nucleic acid-binding protein
MIVVDASVAVKWYLNEPGSDEAAALLTTPGLLCAPELIRVEVPGAIVRAFRVNRLSEQRTREALGLWDRDLGEGVVKLLPDALLLPAALDHAIRLRHAVQDCLYLSAAVRGEGRLVTADGPFYRRAREQFPVIELLTGCRSN